MKRVVGPAEPLAGVLRKMALSDWHNRLTPNEADALRAAWRAHVDTPFVGPQAMKRVVVPAEPTPGMSKEGRPFIAKAFPTLDGAWQAMLAAAPRYEPNEAEVEAAASAMGWSQYIGAGWEGFKTAAEYWAGIPEETRQEHRKAARAALVAADKARRG